MGSCDLLLKTIDVDNIVPDNLFSAFFASIFSTPNPFGILKWKIKQMVLMKTIKSVSNEISEVFNI